MSELAKDIMGINHLKRFLVFFLVLLLFLTGCSKTESIPTGANLPIEEELFTDLSWTTKPLLQENSIPVKKESEVFSVGHFVFFNLAENVAAYNLSEDKITKLSYNGNLVCVTKNKDDYDLLLQAGDVFSIASCDDLLNEKGVKSIQFSDFPSGINMTSYTVMKSGMQFCTDELGVVYQYQNGILLSTQSDIMIQKLFVIDEQLYGFSGNGTPTFYHVGINDLSLSEISIPNLPSNSIWYTFSTENNRFYLDAGNQLWVVNPSDETSKVLIDYKNSDLDIIPTKALPLNNEELLLMQFYSEGTYFYRAHQRTAEDLANIQTISLATFEESEELTKLVRSWNRQQDSYRIVIKPYLTYNGSIPTSEDLEQSYLNFDQFQKDLLQGIIPDIICTDKLDYYSLSNKGLFFDLQPYMDSDPDFQKNDYFSNVFDALSYQGRNERITFSFSLSSCVAKTSLLEGKTALSVDECFALQLPNEMRLFPQNDGKDVLCSELLLPRLYNYIDYEKQKCYFDTPEFIQLLKLCNTGVVTNTVTGETELNIPFYHDAEEWRKDRALLYTATIHNFIDYHGITSIVFEDDPITLVGFPQSERASESLILPGATIAICSNSLHKEAIWDFIKFSMKEEIILIGSDAVSEFPVNREAFQAYYDYQNGLPSSKISQYVKVGDRDFEIGNPTAEEKAVLTDYIDQTHALCCNDRHLYQIVQEETGSYFAGDTTAEQAAKNIQGRVHLYLSERD